MPTDFGNAARELARRFDLGESEQGEIAAFLVRFGVRCGQEVANRIASASSFSNAQILSCLHDTEHPDEIRAFFEESEDNPYADGESNEDEEFEEDGEEDDEIEDEEAGEP